MCTSWFDIYELYILPTVYLCVLYLFQNQQRLLPRVTQNDSI
jgi:hypothetical protein